ncbi:MAG TPA: glycosyl hydrolase family 28-related protein, partial [Armatimonadota bacterium]|nr:glycosyl hydrolase family 28-related protein [Armatimonadota bacterium]
MRIAIVLLILMALISLASRCAAQGPDEFVGPFPSWANVRTLYHARGDGRADDTAALQSALDDLGKPGHSTVLYLPTGTYRITHGLTMKSRINVSMIGEDPARTIIRWDGPAGGVMLDCDGVSYSRFDRVTWDGAGRALTAVMHGWDGHIPYANTEGEHADEVFENVGFGVRGGSKGFMDAECEISRCKFMHCSKAGLSIENFNALDWFVWDSLFEDCARGVTNTFGAGNFHVYRSLFLRSTIADLSIGNTEYFSFRDNVSIGSRAFFIASGIGAACPTTIQGNTIIDPVNPTPIRIGNLGPCLLLDNTIKSRPGKRPVVTFNPSGASPIIIGNRFTVADPILDAAKNPYYLHNRVVSPASIPIPKRRLPEPARRRARPVIEIPAGSTSAAIQKAIDTASRMRGKRPVVHLPAGEYPVNRTLMVPAGSDVQLVGDGFATTLKWSGAGAGPVLQLDGPSRATLRDLSIDGAGTADGIRAISCDQIGGRVYMDQSSVHGGKQN